MSELSLDRPLPEEVTRLALPVTGGGSLRLADLRGRWVVLYFYPKDATPGCTREGRDFKALHPAFAELGAVVLGVSRDSLASHERFKAKEGFPFELLADTEEALCRAFGVLRPKKMYGREVVGVERSTFLIDPQGVLRRAWRKVKVDGHAQEVLEALRQLAGAGEGRGA
ncbi:MAG: peroxiredoxin [Gammaproteobacteria bacterium]|nr:MAG: peroxiredoxin [Gammaproteobacteria bacterium]